MPQISVRLDEWEDSSALVAYSDFDLRVVKAAKKDTTIFLMSPRALPICL